MKIHAVELPLGEPGRHEVVLLADHAQALAKMLAERDTAQAQLAEAVGLLKHVKSWFGWGDLPESLSKLDAFLARHAQARAALATQPAAGEPVAWIIESPEGCSPCKSINHLKHMAERYAAAGWSVTPLYAAPPAAAHGDSLTFSTAQELATAIRQVSAYEDLGPELIAEEMFKQAGAVEAAHGDEAVRKDAERWRYGAEHGFPDAMRQIHPVEGPVYWVRDWQQGGEQFETAEAAIDAAMRAQGDGEVQ